MEVWEGARKWELRWNEDAGASGGEAEGAVAMEVRRRSRGRERDCVLSLFGERGEGLGVHSHRFFSGGGRVIVGDQDYPWRWIISLNG